MGRDRWAGADTQGGDPARAIAAELQKFSTRHNAVASPTYASVASLGARCCDGRRLTFSATHPRSARLVFSIPDFDERRRGLGEIRIAHVLLDHALGVEERAVECNRRAHDFRVGEGQAVVERKDDALEL